MTCEHCHKTIEKNRKGKKFCSAKCRMESNMLRYLQRKKDKYKIEKDPVASEKIQDVPITI